MQSRPVRSPGQTHLSERFEKLWRTQHDAPPNVFAFLNEFPRASLDEQLEVLLVDLEHRYQRNSALPVQEYLKLVPAVAGDVNCKLKLLVSDFRYLNSSNGNVPVAQFADQFPDVRGVLIQRLTDAQNNLDQTHCEATISLVGGPLTPLDSMTGAKDRSSRDALPTLLSRKMMGRYRVVELLGQGGFGSVFLARDEELERLVAVKVPLPSRIQSDDDVEKYLAEARVVASLDHPNIVPVYDVGRTDDGICYVVSRWIDGNNLSQFVKQNQPTRTEAALLLAKVADALHYAHSRGLVHRDIKPGNILIDSTGNPFIIDFGLALKEEDYGTGVRMMGTPSYMSPEQARGEGHLVDARSDIFSLGIVLYELLTGLRPFKGKSAIEVTEQINRREARALRVIDRSIPRELERICLKSISKRAADRYTTALDMAEDLQLFAAQKEDESAVVTTTQSLENFTSSSSMMGRQLVQVIPKGLRSFDSDDADFFLALLPGPKDRDGLPESVRFWKTRIAERDAANTFRVGLIYGPSGCGKSSLVKAGLLPRLDQHVVPVYLEATATDMETRLLKLLRMRCNSLPPELNLTEALTWIRRGNAVPSSRKVVVIIDQFEQWLHNCAEDSEPALVRALRQCDGENLQCLLMVRDDFWLAASRLMRTIEVEQIEGRNMAMVDLFDKPHARRVLSAFGRAFGCLPEELDAISKEQQAFVDEAIEELADDGKIVPVRLALVAEMIKAKPWTRTTLKQLGGTAGIGVTFLEETFSASSAAPARRLHEKAARAVLRALLPESGSNIKGFMRPYDELFELSGYAGRPRDFESLIQLLDSELRLITPTDLEGAALNDRSELNDESSRDRYYQLTHDYLVPSVREWLTRRQKETIRGRAEIVLDEHSSLWSEKPERRRLPSWLQWVTIMLMTAHSRWTESQRRLMRSATIHHLGRSALVVLLLVIVGWGMWYVRGRMKADALLNALVTAEITQVSAVIDDIGPYRHWVDPQLTDIVEEAPDDSRERLHASLALLPVDEQQGAYLRQRLLHADPVTASVICSALVVAQREESRVALWEILKDSSRPDAERFRAAQGLATFDPPHDGDDEHWQPYVDFIANTLVDSVIARAGHYTPLMEAFYPARDSLFSALHDVFVEQSPDQSRRKLATSFLLDYTADQPELLVELIADADTAQFNLLFPRLEAHKQQAIQLLRNELAVTSEATDSELERATNAHRTANAAAALLRFDEREGVWDVFKQSPNPSARSLLVHRVEPLGVSAAPLASRLEVESDVSACRALLLAIGEYDISRLDEDRRQTTIASAQRMYVDDHDPGVHSSAEWLLRSWGQEEWLRDSRKEATATSMDHDWYRNSEGITLVIVDGRDAPEVGRVFEMATKEITRHQIERYDPNQRHNPESHPTLDCPAGVVTWHQAIRYCQWLNEREGIPESEWCYPPISEIQDGDIPVPTDLNKTGYRLPTQAEFEFAALAGATTNWFFGNNDELIAEYAVIRENSEMRSWPGGRLKPNDLGLFDIHGNLAEWRADISPWDSARVLIGGGSFGTFDIERMAPGRYETTLPDLHYNSFGFRVGRTHPKK